MSKQTKAMRRLCIYFFFDSDGIVDAYVLDCLKKMAKHTEKILFVSNSKLTSESKKHLATIKIVEVKERPNEGFDVWAYKHGIDSLGWEQLRTYDEVIFMNFTIVGPVYPLSEMFNEMDKRDVDFWGINTHSGEPYDPWGIMPDERIPKHLQSHFIVVRQRLLQSEELKRYWDTMRPIKTYEQAVGYHEAIFTKTFSDLGYAWSSYIDTEYLEEMISYPLMFMPREVIIKKRAPFFKRKALFLETREYISATAGTAAAETIECVQEIGYDLSLVMPHVARTANQYDIRQALNAITIVSEHKNETTNAPSNDKAIVILVDRPVSSHVIEVYLDTILSAVGEVHVITAGKQADTLKTKLETSFKNDKLHIATGTFTDYLRCIERVSQKTKAVGVVLFADPIRASNGLSEFEWNRYGFEALLLNKNLIDNAVNELDNSKIYGAFAAPRALHNGYDQRWRYWDANYEKIKDFLKAVGSKAYISQDKPALESPNGIYWIQSDVLAGFPWTRIIETFERFTLRTAQDVFSMAIPYLVQDRGKITAYAMSTQIARNNMTLMEYKRLQGIMNVNDVPVSEFDARPGTFFIKTTKGYTESAKVAAPQKTDKLSGRVVYGITIPQDCEEIRFDPVDGSGVASYGVQATINGKRHPIHPVNATIHNRIGDLFVTDDPQYIIEGAMKANDVVSISFSEIETFTYFNFIQGVSSQTGEQFGAPVARFLQSIQREGKTKNAIKDKITSWKK